MKGNLRADLFAQLLRWEKEVDLCLTLGTSLAGMNADRVAVSCGERAQQGRGLGTIIVNLQRTKKDHLASLRIFARLDDVLVALAERLGIPAAAYADEPCLTAPSAASETADPGRDVFLIPYDAKGRRVAAADGGSACRRALDLREGARVRVTAGPYSGDEGIVRGRRRDGHFDIVLAHQVSEKMVAQVPVLLGSWFVDGALAGSLPTVPVVSVASGHDGGEEGSAGAAALGERTGSTEIWRSRMRGA